jgi:4,5-dihydroxyphthalate decarboxylase
MRLSGALGDFDRTRPLLDGRVRVAGFDIEWQTGELESLFSRAFEGAELDITELSFSNFLIATAKGGSPYIALPVFPTRSFRHHALFIRGDRGIRTPRDLEGKRVGLREYTNTASLVLRGILASYYGVDLSRIRWVVGDIDKRERTNFPLPALPAPYDIMSRSDVLLSDLLESGELDALIAYAPPHCLGRNGVRRMFERWWEEEARYFRDTRVFPIMHVVVLRRLLVERHPELPRALFEAFCEAKRLALRDLEVEAAPKTMLPWAPAHLAQTRELLGRDFWSYGLAANRTTLEAQIGFSRNQHLIAREVTPEELFAEAAHGLRDG